MTAKKSAIIPTVASEAPNLPAEPTGAANPVEIEGLEAEVEKLLALVDDYAKRLEKLEAAVYKPKDRPINTVAIRNANSDPGPFRGGSGMNTMK